MLGSITLPSFKASWETWLERDSKPEQEVFRDEGFLGTATVNTGTFFNVDSWNPSNTWTLSSPSTWNLSTSPSARAQEDTTIPDEVSFGETSERASQVNRSDNPDQGACDEAIEGSSVELRIEPSLSFVRVYSEDAGGCEDVELEYQPISSKKIKHNSTFSEDAAEYMRKQLIAYLKKQKTERDDEGTKKKSKKERKSDLKKYLKKSLKAYLHAKEAADDASQKKHLEKTVGEMIKKAVFSEEKESKERKAAKKKKKKEEKKKSSRSSIPRIPKFGEKSKATNKKKHKEDEEIEDQPVTPEASEKTEATEAAEGAEVAQAQSEEFPDDEVPTELPKASLQKTIPRGVSESDGASSAGSNGGVSKFSSAIDNMIQSEFQRLEELESMLDQEKALKKKLAAQEKAKSEEKAVAKAVEKAFVEAEKREKVQHEVRECLMIQCLSDESHDERDKPETQEAAPLASASSIEISDEKRNLEAEIAAEMAKLQALQNEFVAKVHLASFEGSSVLKSDLFSKTVYGHESLRSQKSLDQDLQLQGELERLRQEQSNLFAKGRQLTSRNNEISFEGYSN